jgi:hypothetical protein
MHFSFPMRDTCPAHIIFCSQETIPASAGNNWGKPRNPSVPRLWFELGSFTTEVRRVESGSGDNKPLIQWSLGVLAWG